MITCSHRCSCYMMPCHSVTGSRSFKQPSGLETLEPSYPRGGVLSHQGGNVITETVLVRKIRKISFAPAVIESESLGYTERGKTYWGKTIATGKPRIQTRGMIQIKPARRSQHSFIMPCERCWLINTNCCFSNCSHISIAAWTQWSFPSLTVLYFYL